MWRTGLFVCFLTMASASGAILSFQASLAGVNEVPATGSPATGFAVLSLDTTANTLDLQLDWAGLIGGNPSAAHIHCCAPIGTNAIVAVGFPGFPAATSGSYTHQFNLLDISIYTSAYVTASGGTLAGAETRLINGLSSGAAYVNIHNSTFPGGEIRGQVVPEPASILFMLAGAGLLAVRRRFAA